MVVVAAPMAVVPTHNGQYRTCHAHGGQSCFESISFCLTFVLAKTVEMILSLAQSFFEQSLGAIPGSDDCR